MSIREKSEKIKSFWVNMKDKLYSEESGLKIKGDLLVVILIIFVGLISFGLGKLSALEKTDSSVSAVSNNESQVATVLESSNSTTSSSSPIQNVQKTKSVINASEGVVFASKSGTRYYYPSCTSRVKEENKIWFSTIAEAEATGRTLASGCNK